MKKIKGITRKLRSNARNGEHVDYHTNVTEAITPEFAEKYKISKQYSTYTGWFGQEKLIYKPNTGFEQTEDIEAKDRIRDEIALYLKGQIESNLYCPIEAKKAAAKLLEHAMRPYADAHNKSYAENTAEINAWVAVLKSDTYAPAVTELALDEAVAKLDEANQDFKETLNARSREKRKRDEQETMKTIRPKVDDAYVSLVNAINALYLANEIATQDEETRTELGAVIDEINSLIAQLEDVLERRGVKPGTDDEEEEEPESEPEPTPVTPEITAVYQKEGGDPENPHRIERGKKTGVEYQGFTLKGQDGTLEHVIGLVNDQDYIEWINPETISNVTETGCEFTMVPDLTEGQYKVRIETYDGGSPLVVEYPEPITLW